MLILRILIIQIGTWSVKLNMLNFHDLWLTELRLKPGLRACYTIARMQSQKIADFGLRIADWTILLFFLTISLCCGCQEKIAPHPLRNVYIITASGLRPDHLTCYDYQHGQTAQIDF